MTTPTRLAIAPITSFLTEQTQSTSPPLRVSRLPTRPGGRLCTTPDHENARRTTRDHFRHQTTIAARLTAPPLRRGEGAGGEVLLDFWHFWPRGVYPSHAPRPAPHAGAIVPADLGG